MEKIKKGYKLKSISLIVVVLFLFNNTAYGIDLYRESCIRASLLFGREEIGRRRFLQASAVVVTENGFAQSTGSERYNLQKDIAENLYSRDQKTREAAKDRLLKIASQDQRILIYLLELLINEDIRAEASGKEKDKIFSSMLQELSQNANAQEAFLLIFKYGINQRIRQKAIIFFAIPYMSLANKQRVGREHDYLPDFYNALIDPDMRYAAQIILNKIAEENANVRHIIIKDLLSMRELAEFRNNDKALNFLDEALDQLAKPESLLMTLGLFNYNIKIQAIKRLAKAKNLNENTPKDSNTVDMIKDFLEDSEMRGLAIDVLTKIAPKRGEFHRALWEQSFIADIFGDTKTSEQCLNTMRQLINESQDLVPWFLYLDAYNPATLPKILTVISMTSDDILGKIEFISNRTKAQEDRPSEAEVAFSIRRFKQLIDLSMIPLYRDRIMSILSRINVNYQGFEEFLDSIKETYPSIYEKRQQLLIDTNPMRALLQQLEEIHSDIDKKRQQFMGRLKSVIKDPRIVERDVSYKDVQVYLDSILGWEDSLTGESYLRYREIGLQVDLSDLFTMFDNPDYSDIRQQIFNKIAIAKDFIIIQTNPKYIKLCIDSLKQPGLQEYSALILSGIQIGSLKLRRYLIETLLELRDKNVEISETEDIISKQIDAFLEGKSDEYIEIMLVGKGYNANIDVEVIKRLSRIDNIQLSAYNISTVEMALREYPEIREAALKLLKAHSLPEGEIEEIVEKANKSAESKGAITIAQEFRKGDMIDKLFERHATSIDILRVAHETKDYKVRHQALIILSKAGNLDVAFQVTPHALETVVEELSNSELMQVAQDILTKKITDPYLKRIASGILFLKVPNLFSLQDVVRILDQEGVSDPVIRQRALDMLAKSRSLTNVQAGYPTAQVVVAAIDDPSSVKSAESLLIAFKIGNRVVKRDIIRALISEKIVLDIKGDAKNRDRVIAILKSISDKQEGVQILSDIVNNDIDPRIVKEADSLLKKNATYNNAIPVFGAMDTRGGFTGVRFFRSLLYSI